MISIFFTAAASVAMIFNNHLPLGWQEYAVGAYIGAWLPWVYRWLQRWNDHDIAMAFLTCAAVVYIVLPAAAIMLEGAMQNAYGQGLYTVHPRTAIAFFAATAVVECFSTSGEAASAN